MAVDRSHAMNTTHEHDNAPLLKKYIKVNKQWPAHNVTSTRSYSCPMDASTIGGGGIIQGIVNKTDALLLSSDFFGAHIVPWICNVHLEIAQSVSLIL